MISIIVPIYKVEQYLKRCVDSLINQTYRNLEIILVDDGSPDRCGEICDEYAKNDSRVKAIHKPNGGLSDARNKGLDVATGDYVMFVDSDDWLDLVTCEAIIKVATKYDAGLVVFGVKNVYDNGHYKDFLPRCDGPISKTESIKALIYNIPQSGIFNYACNKLYSKELFNELRFEKGRLAEDQGLTYKLIHYANRVAICREVFYNYYQRDGSISKRKFNPKQIVDRTTLWMERLEFIKKNYPDLEKYQVAQILGDIYISQIVLKDKNEFSGFRDAIIDFANRYKSVESVFVNYNKRIKLHYFCYPLFWLYVKLFVK